jgi:hypothetical protein
MNDASYKEELKRKKMALLAELNHIDKELNKAAWSPVGGEFYVNCYGNVVKDKSDKKGNSFGVERPTEEQARRASIEMRKFNRLLALRDELCGDEVVDWNDIKKPKFFIVYAFKESKWICCPTIFFKSIEPSFTTEEIAKRACDMLNSGEVVL